MNKSYRIICLLFFFLLGCQTTSPLNHSSGDENKNPRGSMPAENSYGSAASDNSDESQSAGEDLKNFIRTRNLEKKGAFSKSLFSILKEAKLLDQKNKAVLMDLFCQIQAKGEQMVTECSFVEKQKSRWAKRTIRGEIAESLRLELSNFPLALGESGVLVPYLRCGQEQGNPKCDLAMDLDYSGP